MSRREPSVQGTADSPMMPRLMDHLRVERARSDASSGARDSTERLDGEAKTFLRSTSRKFVFAVLAAVLVLHLTASYILRAPGVLSIDEVGYHFMTRAFAEGTAPTIWNGYEDLPSSSLEVSIANTIVAREGQLISKYPYLGPLLASVLYERLGFYSLVVVNSVALVPVLLFTWCLARRFLNELGALTACLILLFGTFAWEYSQGAWPHMLALSLLMGAVHCLVRSIESGNDSRSSLWGLLAGLLFGVGTGARLDVVLGFSATGSVLLLIQPARLRQLVFMAVGLVPGLLALSYDNYLKHGLFWPLAYASPHRYQQFLPAVVIAILVVGLGRWLRNGGSSRLSSRLSWWVGGVAAAAFTVSLTIPETRNVVFSAFRGLYALVVDLSAIPMESKGPSMMRSETGAVVYAGVFKKALLQSCCFLPVAVVGAVGLRRRSGVPLSLLVLLPVVYIVGFGVTGWHGGLCFNLRYLLPTLPFLSILAAAGLLEVCRKSQTKVRVISVGAAFVTAGVYVALMWSAAPGSGAAEFAVLTFPLLLALGLAVLSLVFLSGTERLRGFSKSPLLVGTASALVLSGLIGFTYDYQQSRLRRNGNAAIGRAVLERLDADSLVFVPFFDPYASLIQGDRIRVANPGQDGFASVARLAEFHISNKRRVYAVAPRYMAGFLVAVETAYPPGFSSFENVAGQVLVELRPNRTPGVVTRNSNERSLR